MYILQATCELDFHTFTIFSSRFLHVDCGREKRSERCLTFCLSVLLGGSVSDPTVAFSSFSVAAELLRLLLATGRIWMWNFLGSSSSKSESLE